MQEMASFIALFNFEKILYLAIGILCLWAIGRMIGFLLERIANYFPSKRFLVLQTSTLSNFILYLGGFIALFIIIINPPKEVVFAATGSLAVAIGFALKDITSSILAGVVLLFDTPFKTGDRIHFDGNYGEIISIGLRSVKIRSLDDNIITIPNARFINDTVASSNYGALDMMVVTSFHISVNNDIDKVKEIINEVIMTSRFSYLKKPISFAIEEVVLHNMLAIRIDAKAYVMDVSYEKLFQSDITSTVNKQLQKNSIQRF